MLIVLLQYNEHNPAFPPPPIALPPQTSFEHGAGGGGGGGQTLGMDEMAAILDSGFDDQPFPPTFRPHVNNVPSPLHRHQHEFTSQPQSHSNGYTSLDDHQRTPEMPTSADSVSSSIDSRPHGSGGHAKKRSAGGSGFAAVQNRYGPMGPLADEDEIYGKNGFGSGGFKGRKI